ncbi:elongation of very long chain fatty acids protein [Acrasis kona]|uniref:Elongation of fatty acids protein n=1 Tax=Acrasis kona TaxID=1008807 RepID=A0AAW2ZF01_9EUKA
MIAISSEQCPLLHTHTHSTPLISLALYLSTIYLLPKAMRAAGIKGFNVKVPMALWNLFLTVISVAMLVGMAGPWFGRWKEVGLLNLLCDETGYFFERPSTLQFWMAVFLWSKYAELFDTVFLILKNPERKVPFLHWYHHTTVLLVAWYSMYYKFSPSLAFMATNTLIHSFMYLYYFLMEIGIKPPGAIILTVGQIIQMMIGIAVNAIFAYQVYYQKRKCNCLNSDFMVASAVVMYGSYLYLFVQFFISKYLGPKVVKPKQN